MAKETPDEPLPPWMMPETDDDEDEDDEVENPGNPLNQDKDNRGRTIH